MEYTIKQFGKMAGITTRTLRYYDEIGLLNPARVNSSGYRIYGAHEVDRLQQILFFKELGMSLENIQAILADPAFDGLAALQIHLRDLQARREQLDVLIRNVTKTIAAQEGGIKMTDREKFAGFKKQLIEDNERKYGSEVRAKYGDEAINRSNKAFAGMSHEEYKRFEQLSEDVTTTLAAAYLTGDPAGELAQKAARLHKEWITACWGTYNPQAHAGLAQMYVDDERFTAYYDHKQPGAAAFLRDAVFILTGTQK